MVTAIFDIKDIDRWVAQETGYHSTAFELRFGIGKAIKWRKLRDGNIEIFHIDKKLKGII
jgi:hypothetical protein